MRISSKGRHAVMAMTDISRNGIDKPVPLAEVAKRQNISLSYLEQLIAKLKARGLLTSTRGPGGGYKLSVPADRIPVFDIVDAVDDPIPRIHIADPLTASGKQLTDLLWQAIGDEIRSYLKTITLNDVNNCTLCDSESNSLEYYEKERERKTGTA